jgi:hypothetical protein
MSKEKKPEDLGAELRRTAEDLRARSKKLVKETVELEKKIKELRELRKRTK